MKNFSIRFFLPLRTFLFLCTVFLCSCNARHVTEIMRIKAASDNKEEQIRSVRAVNERFDALLVALRNNTLDTCQTKDDFLKRFGEPIFIKKFSDMPAYTERWLYRYAEDLWKSDKVYVYFDAQGKTVTWEYQPPPPQEPKL